MGCNRIIKSTGFGTTDTNLIILTSGTHTLTNGCMYDLIVCQRKPSLATVSPVLVQVNGVNYPLLDRIGNPVMSDQITCRTRYRMFFGSNTPHFLTINCLKCSQLYAPTTTTPAPAPAVAVALDEEVDDNA